MSEHKHTGWTDCEVGCLEPWCNIHGMHVCECNCPGLQYFTMRGIDPYADDWHVVHQALFVDTETPIEGRRTH